MELFNKVNLLKRAAWRLDRTFPVGASVSTLFQIAFSLNFSELLWKRFHKQVFRFLELLGFFYILFTLKAVRSGSTPLAKLTSLGSLRRSLSTAESHLILSPHLTQFARIRLRFWSLHSRRQADRKTKFRKFDSTAAHSKNGFIRQFTAWIYGSVIQSLR